MIELIAVAGLLALGIAVVGTLALAGAVAWIAVQGLVWLLRAVAGTAFLLFCLLPLGLLAVLGFAGLVVLGAGLLLVPVIPLIFIAALAWLLAGASRPVPSP